MKRTLMIAACVTLGSLASAQKGVGGATSVLEVGAQAPGVANTTPTLLGSSFDAASGNTVLNFDMTGQESWDGAGDASNTVLGPGIPDGASFNGVGWDVTIATVGASWLSEPVAGFDGLINLTFGVGDDFAGTSSYSSGGIINFADIPLPDIAISGDLAIELFEAFDDVADAVDANYTGGSLDLQYSGGAAGVPTVSQWGLIILTVLLLLGVVAMSVKSKEAVTA